MSYPPKIKPSHRGLLHQELGIPQGEKIGEARLEAAKARAKRTHNTALMKRANFALNFNDNGHHGYVVSIRQHHSRPNYMSLEVAHGKRSSKNPDGSPRTDSYDDRPTSSLVIPRHQAKHFRIGQRVGLGAVPLEGLDTDEMMDDDADDISTMKHRLTREIARGRGSRKR